MPSPLASSTVCSVSAPPDPVAVPDELVPFVIEAPLLSTAAESSTVVSDSTKVEASDDPAGLKNKRQYKCQQQENGRGCRKPKLRMKLCVLKTKLSGL